jgi:hypothetical protein
MADITITIPLAYLGEAENLSPTSILEAFQTATQQKEKIEELVEVVNKAGKHLTSIIDELDGMEKASALRQLAEQMTGYENE